ncbi:hypothetical protein [Chelatococcus asaccharovorans]|uniref:hypothetical protein n=1 Tax=Chelatococcus asaccharovorans TaxID=28210 RepID=UPI0022640F2C|nr:hypothetical protein [Chelatococcus asaccharovorans]
MSSIVVWLACLRTLHPNASRTKADKPVVTVAEITGGALPPVLRNSASAAGAM